MNLLRKLLFPVVPIYYMVTWLRNKLYDVGMKPSISYNFPVICVGNLSVGGTGKTPMIEYLIESLKDDYKVATLSRGYKRKTQGFRLADSNDSADTIGDEPFQFYTKYHNDGVGVAVDANRRRGINNLKAFEPEVILLDDAYQHRKVKAGFNILLTTFKKPYYKDIVLPFGDLREPKSGAKRANAIVVTKCPPDLNDSEKNKIIKYISPLAHQKVFFSAISYSKLVYSTNDSIELSSLRRFTLVTGIANAFPLVDFLKGETLLFDHLEFNDHHNFSEDDIMNLSKKELILTTEKDFMRLKQYEILEHKLYYLPIAVTIDDAAGFNEYILDFVKHS
ncbi:tetraacyldisaccharide 4'-kinase [Cognatitamlana onchidii]|uniref:tetraacyldisaccharide 4'-kinase n=1 Tax=Cognatitamlana onchidii TaxID=2562860 RepID=UPI0010A68204|nr:tetraacyldisaccharide 4'-kinase [Algibacter onchidii]